MFLAIELLAVVIMSGSFAVVFVQSKTAPRHDGAFVAMGSSFAAGAE